jgi:hypothetical protein
VIGANTAIDGKGEKHDGDPRESGKPALRKAPKQCS